MKRTTVLLYRLQFFQLQLKGGYDPLFYRLRPEGSYHSLVFRLLPKGGYDLLSLPRPATLIRRILPNLWTCQIQNPVLSADIICTLITAKSSLQSILSHHLSAHVITVMLIKLLINTAGYCQFIKHQGLNMSSSRSTHLIIIIQFIIREISLSTRSVKHNSFEHHHGICIIIIKCRSVSTSQSASS